VAEVDDSLLNSRCVSTIYLASRGPEDWRRLLRDPAKQWRKGFSARTLAYCWEAASGDWPRSIKQALRESGSELLAGARILIAFPEHAVPVGGAGGDSKADLWLLARSGDSLISVAVEGKVDEPLGELVSDWLRTRELEAERRGRPTNAPRRRELLEQRLRLRPEQTNSLRYQLLHRTASALIEAERFKADVAVMLVHSFGPKRTGFEDFARFVAAMGGEPPEGDAIVLVGRRGTVDLYLGWAHGEDEYLTAKSVPCS
jgi:hypothetical protein